MASYMLVWARLQGTVRFGSLLARVGQKSVAMAIMAVGLIITKR